MVHGSCILSVQFCNKNTQSGEVMGVFMVPLGKERGFVFGRSEEGYLACAIIVDV